VGGGLANRARLVSLFWPQGVVPSTTFDIVDEVGDSDLGGSRVCSRRPRVPTVPSFYLSPFAFPLSLALDLPPFVLIVLATLVVHRLRVLVFVSVLDLVL